jgi:hypothetical protein
MSSNSSNDLPNISAVISETSNFAMERYIRQGEINSCMSNKNYHGQQDQCACVLAGAKDYKACLKGYRDVRENFKHLDTNPFPPLVWCVDNMQKKSQSTNDDTQQGWITGCINGIRN